MSDIDSDSRLGAAIKQLTRGAVGARTELTIVNGDWLSTIEVTLVRNHPKPQPKRRGGVLVIHPKRSAPGQVPAPDGGGRKE